MQHFIDWFPYALTGAFMIFFGCVKMYGVVRGIEGGRDKPALEYLCGT